MHPRPQNSEQGRFLTGSTMGHVVRMTMTSAVGITFVFVVDAANLFWISKLGQPVLMAAVGYAVAVQYLSVSVVVGLMIAATALISQQIGRGEGHGSRRTATACMIHSVVICAIVAALLIGLRHPLLAAAGASGEPARLAARYLAISLTSLPIMALALTASGALRAFGDGKRAMFVTLSSGAVAMVIDPVLIVWAGMGLDGAGWAIVIFRIVMAAVALRFAIGTHDLLGRPERDALRNTAPPLARIAVPAIATQMAAPFGNYVLTSVIAGFGDAAVAGWAVINRLTVVAFGGIFSLAAAIGGIFGQNFGAQQFDRLRSTYRDALIFVLVYTMIAWILLYALTGRIAAMFDLTPDATTILRAFTTVGAGAFTLTGALYVSNAAFNTLGKPARATVLNWTKDGLLAWPVAIWMAGFWQASGVIYAQAATGAVAGLVAAVWGWVFLSGIGPDNQPRRDRSLARSYRNPDLTRRR